MLEVRSLGVRYGTTRVLDGLDFDLEPGTLTALVGPNGTGKSSLLKAIAGLVRAEGSVGLRDRGRLDPEARFEARFEAIAYMPQESSMSSSLTVLEVVLLGRLPSLGMRVSPLLCAGAIAALERFKLGGLHDRTLAELSGGQRQMVYLAQSLFRSPRVLLLDEPTAALDIRHQLVVLDRIKRHCAEHGTIGLAAMHDLSLAARYSDRMLFLSRGTIVADGAPGEVLDTELLRDTYGVHTEVVKSASGTLHVTPIRAMETLETAHLG